MKNIARPLFLLIALFFSVARADDKAFDMKFEPAGVFIRNVNVAVMQKIFEDYGYQDYLYMPDWTYPPLFLDNMPTDFASVTDKDLRNKLFIQILAPLALYVNEKILLERVPLMEMKQKLQNDGSLTKEERQKLEAAAVKYDIFTRMQGTDREHILLDELLRRVDGVPPSILIAVAAAESNWGTAREVALGNALYKQKVWYTDEGIKPLDDTDDSYRIKIYPTLLAAMEEYALKINSDINFKSFRDVRYYRRYYSSPLRGNAMVHNLVLGSPLENYAGLISYTITFYDLVNIDEAKLGSIKMFMEKKEES